MDRRAPLIARDLPIPVLSASLVLQCPSLSTGWSFIPRPPGALLLRLASGDGVMRALTKAVAAPALSRRSGSQGDRLGCSEEAELVVGAGVVVLVLSVRKFSQWVCSDPGAVRPAMMMSNNNNDTVEKGYLVRDALARVVCVLASRVD